MSHLYFKFSTIFYSTLLYTHFNKMLWDHGDSNPWEKPRTSNAKSKRRLMSSKRPRAIGNMQFFVSWQIHVVNKQVFYPLSWNYPLSKIALAKSYILMIDRHLDAKKQLLRCCGSYFLFYYLLLGCTMTNFGPLSKGKPR